MGFFKPAKIIDSPEGRRRDRNAEQLRARGDHAAARREERRSRIAWDRAGQVKKPRWF